MLVPPHDSSQGNSFSLKDLRAHSLKRAGRLGAGRVKSGLSIGSLRATSGPPSNGLSPAGAAGTTGLQRTVQGQEASLLDLPADGQDLVAHLRAQVRSTSPLTAGVAGQEATRSAPVSMEVLQARQNQARQRFQQLDRQSRFLHASSHPLRQNNGFGLKPSATTLNLLG